MPFAEFEFMAFYCPLCQRCFPEEDLPNTGWAECIYHQQLFKVERTIVVYAEHGIIKQDTITGDLYVGTRVTDSEGSSAAVEPDGVGC